MARVLGVGELGGGALEGATEALRAELTDKGRAAHRAVYAAHADRAAAVFATLDQDDQQALLGLMRRLLDALAATSTAEGRPLNLDTKAFRSR